MNHLISSDRVPGQRRRPIAACIVSIFALSAPAAMAANIWPVTNCNDTGPGSLRDVIGAGTTVSGDTVDLSALACSTISLSVGEITIPQNSLTIKGPVASTLIIDDSGLPSPPGGTGYSDSRPFTHTGTGTLTIRYLGITGGHVYHTGPAYSSRGGCIYSAGSVVTYHSDISGCSATQAGAFNARGGGIYTKGNLALKYSTLSGNTLSGGSSLGGGARVLGTFTAKYSTVSGNKSYGAGALGGGVNVSGNVTLFGSTISSNYSGFGYAGLDAFSASPASNTFRMSNSTISGNVAASSNGGLYVNSGTTKIYNSTIAFNTAGNGAAGYGNSPGVELAASFSSIAVTLQSTLISNNTYGNLENDLNTHTGGMNTVTFNAGPANNLVRATFAAGLPGDTTFVSCPLLGPLRNNGGLTQTHALLSSSIAIDSGNNVGINPVTTQPNVYDQRGSAANNGVLDYLRVSGPAGDPNPQADIGAYEVQQDDIIFNAGFDGCPLLI